MLIAGKYTVKAVQSRVILQGPAGREMWLGVDLCRGRGGVKVTGWMQRGELQRGAAGNVDWLARLRGKGRDSKAGVWRIGTTAGQAMAAQQYQGMD